MNAILHSRRDINVQVGEEVSTTRRGTEWISLADKGDVVDICICSEDKQEHLIVGTAVIGGTWVGLFRNIPARLVEKDHVDEYRNYTSQLSALRQAYHGEFDEGDMVTVLWYRRLT